MDAATTSMFVFGIYFAVVGAGYLLIPNVVLPMFGFPKAQEVWIRVLGIVVVIIGYYYINAAMHNLTAFYWSTVWGRFALLVTFVVLTLLKKAKPMLIVFGVVFSDN